jgi:hypothetical protein
VSLGMARAATKNTIRSSFVVLAVAGASLAAACHLFLDSDDLVSAQDGGSQNPDGPVGTGEGGGIPVDLPPDVKWDASSPPEWKGQVPGCIPPIPVGAPVFAVVGGEPGGTFTCPAGYDPDPNTGPAFGGVIDTGLLCTKLQCGCGAYPVTSSGSSGSSGGSNQQCDELKLQYSSDPQCATAIGTDGLDQGSFGSCTRVDQAGATHAKVVGRLRTNDQLCPTSGAPGIAKQTPRFGLEVRLCVPKSNSQTCTDGMKPMPPVKDAVACYRAPLGACAPGYASPIPMSLDKAMNDNRQCSCACNAKVDGGCAGGTLNIYGSSGSFSCPGSALGSVPGTCQPVAAFGANVRLSTGPAPEPGAVSCAVASPRGQGAVVPGGQVMQLCCLSRCESCELATISPNGTCLPTLNACKTDTECEQYRQCVNAACNGTDCAQCEKLSDAGAADAGFITPTSLQKFRAIATCQRNACPAPECP